jgi:K+-transporting ATPase KdpF subunit
MRRVVRKNLTPAHQDNKELKELKFDFMMTALFILSIAVFIYLLYVLIKPEKF